MPRPLPFLPVLLGLLWGGPVCADNEPPIKGLDPGAWSIQEYRFPESDLYFSISKQALFDEELYETERKRRLPEPPSSGAEPADFEAHIEASTAYMTERLRELGVFVPEGSRILADPATETLAVETDDRLHAILEQVESVRALSLPRFLRSQLDIVEVPTPLAFQILDRLGNTADHGNILHELRDEPRARWIESGVIESTSEKKAKLSTGIWPDTNSKETEPPAQSGVLLELESYFTPNDSDISLHLNLQTRTGPGRSPPIAGGVLSESKSSIPTSLRNGSTRLIGCKPGTTHEHHQLLWLRCDIVVRDSPSNPLLAQWLQDYTRSSSPESTSTVPSCDPEESFVHRVFPFPKHLSASPSGLAAASTEERNQRLQEILEDQGIGFPQGSSVVATSGLEMIHINTPQSTLEWVDALLGGSEPRIPKVISLRVRILEAERSTLDSVLRTFDTSPSHTNPFEVVRRLVVSGHAQWITAAAFETKNGLKGVFESRTRQGSPAGSTEAQSILIESQNHVDQDDRISVRCSVSVESSTGTKAQFDCDTLLNSGEHRLIGKWIDPTSSNEPEKLRLVWLEAHIAEIDD